MGCLSPALSSSWGSPSTSSSPPFSSLSSLPRPPSRDIPRKQHPLENYARLAYDIAVALEEHADIV